MPDPLRHEALPYTGHAQFVTSSVSLLRDGLSRDERPLFLACQDKVDDVRDALDADAGEVAFVPTDQHGRNPARIMTLLDGFQAGGDGRRALGVNETIVAGHAPAVLAEAQLAEGVLNHSDVSDWELSLVCLYDTVALDVGAVYEMRRSHPVVRGEDDDNADFRADLVDELYSADLPGPTAQDVRTCDVEGMQLTRARDFVRSVALGHGVTAERVDDLVLAANEIVTNSLRHGGGCCTISMWVDGDATVCQVADAGRLTDPLLGRLAPTAGRSSGRGLWLANHLCDLVQIRSSERSTVVRLRVDRQLR